MLEDDVDDFIHNHAKDILIHGKSVKRILQEDDICGLTTEELEPYITKLQKLFEQITTLIEETDENYSIPNNFDDFARDIAFKAVDNKDWYELVYEIIYDTISAESSSNPLWGLNLNTTLSTRSLMRSVSKVPIQIYRDRIKERNNLQDEVQILTGIKEEQEKILKDYGKVSGLWGGLAVLIYACIVGIAIPSMLLPYPVNTYDDIATKQLLLALFFSELMALFVYLGVSMYKLTKED